eukprot:3292089-Rhodomonas_salina.1
MTDTHRLAYPGSQDMGTRVPGYPGTRSCGLPWGGLIWGNRFRKKRISAGGLFRTSYTPFPHWQPMGCGGCTTIVGSVLTRMHLSTSRKWWAVSGHHDTITITIHD